VIDFAVILATGSTLHQSQLTYSRPRVMLPVLGRPMVVRIMERLYRAGIHNFVVVIGENEGAVASYLNSQWLPNVHIEFIIQTLNSSLARTLTNIAKQYQKPFLITAYNTFTHANFPERLLNHYKEFGDSLLLAAAPITLSKSIPYAYAQVENQRVLAIHHEKPEKNEEVFVLGSLAICGDTFVDYLTTLGTNTGGLSKHLLDIFHHYVTTGATTLVAETSWILQIEADYDLLTLNRYLLDDGPDTHILSELPASVQIIPPVRIDPHVSVGQGARLGPRVYLEAGCTIGHHATLTNTIVLQNTVIPAGSNLSDTIVATRAKVEDPDKS
jgi:NDP-sugar pyrophosphorylase family protein